MPRPYASSVISAPADDVWSFVRDFNNLNEWLPAIGSSEIEDGRPADAVGCVRRLALKDGGVVRERLLILDDVDHSYTYEFIERPFPVRSYRSTIRVAPLTDGGHTFVEWWAWYDSDAAEEKQMNETFVGIYTSGLAGLRKRFDTG